MAEVPIPSELSGALVPNAGNTGSTNNAAPGPFSIQKSPKSPKSPSKKRPRKQRKQRKLSEDSGISLGNDEQEFIQKRLSKCGSIGHSTEEEYQEDQEYQEEGEYDESSEYSAGTVEEKELSMLFYQLSKARFLIEKWLDRHSATSFGCLRGHLA